MSRYAMILLGRVIDLVENVEASPKWPPDDKGNNVTAVVCDDTVTIGMVYDSTTGVFSEYTPPESLPEKPPELSQLDRIEEKLDMIAEGTVDQELKQYYNEVNAALNGGE